LHINSSSYAADGDKDENLSSNQHPERKSRLGEAEKLRLLEQEVLNYPGHVIYVGFEHKSYDGQGLKQTLILSSHSRLAGYPEISSYYLKVC